jgi:hypothetical protein
MGSNNGWVTNAFELNDFTKSYFLYKFLNACCNEFVQIVFKEIALIISLSWIKFELMYFSQ